MANLLWVIGASKRGESEPFRFTAVYDFPNIESHIPGDLHLINDQERLPVFLEDLFESEGAFGNRIHSGFGL